ncbi:rhodanese-like domain-containing protein [Streptomyces subrutilus]|uniref:rhodanese-like domain-containing protein n=1 Tax=Streptomyces subrutilus TaxID=36818 RepID=UPI000A98EB40
MTPDSPDPSGPLVGADRLAARLAEPGLVVFDASVGALTAAPAGGSPAPAPSTSTGTCPTTAPRPRTPCPPPTGSPRAMRAHVAAALADPAAAVLDAPTRERFAGAAPEPRPGLRGGHMPGALNLPFADLQGEDGRMRPPAELREAFTALAGERERLYFSCGSGVTACVLALGADLAGYRRPAVYDGSWSEWGLPSNERPVAVGPAG